MTDKELIEKIAHWRKHDFGACACLGNCKRCGYHMCHGCLCFVLDELESRANERQKVLAEVEGWLDERWKRIFPDEYSVRKVTNTAPFDSRIMGIMHENELFKEHLAQMKGGK
jgi:hypothetical protein